MITKKKVSRSYTSNINEVVILERLITKLLPTTRGIEGTHKPPTSTPQTTDLNSSIESNSTLASSFYIANGKPVVVFTEDEKEMLAQTCKWIIICNLSHVRPLIDIIRREFGKVMAAKGWINLPWDYYVWDAQCRIVEPIGTRLAMDKATSIQTDLTKPLVNEILLENRNKGGHMTVITQVVEYETISAYTAPVAGCKGMVMRNVDDAERELKVKFTKSSEM